MSAHAKWLILVVALLLLAAYSRKPAPPLSSASIVAAETVKEGGSVPDEAPSTVSADDSMRRPATVEGVPAPFRAQAVAFSEAPVLIEEVSEPDAEGLVSRVTIQKTEFKYPMIRTFERRRGSASGEIVSRQVMVADHALVTRRTDLSDEAFSALVRAASGEVLKRMNDHGVFLVGFEAKAAGSLEEFLSKIALLAPRGSVTAEPDYLRFAR